MSDLTRVSMLKDAEVAQATGASVRSVRRWRAGGAIQRRYEQKLDDLAYIVDRLSDSFTPEGVAQALRARWHLLDGQTLLDTIATQPTRAVAAVEALDLGTVL